MLKDGLVYVTTLAGVRVVDIPGPGVDLDIDSDNNNGLNDPDRSREEDQIEDIEGNPGKPGKVVFVNDGDTDGDEVPDFADGIDMFGNDGNNASAHFTPLILELELPELIDLSKVKIRFTYSASDPSEITRTGNQEDGFIYTTAPGHLRIWKVDGNASRKKALISSDGDYVGPGKIYSVSDFGTEIEPRTWRFFVEGINVSTDVADQKIKVEVDPYREGFTFSDAIRSTIVFTTDLTVDSDNNCIIDSKDELLEDKSAFVFWLSADKDIDDMDLEDLAPFKIKISRNRILQRGWKYNLEMSGDAVIRIYPHKGDGIKHLTDKDVAEKVAGENQEDSRVIDSSNSFEINPADFQKDEIWFLLKGVRESTDCKLRLVLRDENGREEYADEVLLTIKSVRHMYTVANARERPGVVEWKWNQDGYSSETELGKEKEVLVFVHGYNVPEAGSYEGFDRVFKRLYWAGVTNPAGPSDFIGITWPSDFSNWWDPAFLHFNRDIFSAFKTSIPVGDFIKNKLSNGRTVNVMAHSLGNVLVSNAIKVIPNIGINKYILHQAAVTANAYNANYNYPDGKGGVPTYCWLVEQASDWGYPDDLPNWSRCWGECGEDGKWLNKRWIQETPRNYLDKKDNNVDYWNGCFQKKLGRKNVPSIIGDPWGNYFVEVPKKVERMINTYSKADCILNDRGVIVPNAWLANQKVNRPDLGSWESLPEVPDLQPGVNDMRREWAELSYYFGEVSLPAGVIEIPDIENIENINMEPMGIGGPCSLLSYAVHCAFTGHPFYKVWKFWEYVAGELKK